MSDAPPLGGEDRFDRDLRAVLQDDAPGAAPARLQARVRGSLGAGRGSLLSWQAAAAVLLAAVVMGVAVVGPRPEEPGATPGVTTAGTPPAFATTRPSPLDVAIIGPTIHPGWLGAGGLIDRTHGWAINENDRLLLTSDGGSTWRDVTPAGLAAASRRQVTFIDATTGWVTTDDTDDMSLLVLWRTRDAGQTWARYGIPDVLAPVGWNLTFLDAELGYLESDGSAHPDLRWTTDGGATWSTPIDMWPAANGPAEAVDVVFLDARRGYIVAWYPDGNRLLRTEDGGRTWSRVDLPPVEPDFVLSPARAPEFNEGGQGFLEGVATNFAERTQRSVLLVTDVDGGTWRIASQFDGAIETFVLDKDSWLVRSGSELFATADRGGTYDSTEIVGLPDPFYSMSIDFADRTVGWATVLVGEGPGTFLSVELFGTTDGGATWSRLGDCDPESQLMFDCASPAP